MSQDNLCLCCHAETAVDNKNLCRECLKTICPEEQMKPIEQAAEEYCKTINVDKEYPFRLDGTRYFDDNGRELTFASIFEAGATAERERIWAEAGGEVSHVPVQLTQGELKRIIFGDEK